MGTATGEKTESPTPRRVEEARRRGEVGTSRDLLGATVFLAAFGVLAVTARGWVAGLLIYFRVAFGQATAAPTLAGAGRRALEAFLNAVAAPVLAAVVAAVLVGGLQTRGLVSFSAFRLDLARVLPDRRRVISAAVLSEIGKGAVKVALIGGVAWLSVLPLLGPVVASAGSSPSQVIWVVGRAAERIALPIAIVATGLGGLDLLWQRWHHRRRLRMTREEVKREQRQSEGDRTHKAERQRLHRELLEQRMLEEVRRADFVVVNPDHIAVAIRYDQEGPSAPVVVAKGERLSAERIKEIAREAGIPIFRDVGLARSLRDVREGEEIPAAVYEAVAEILRVVRNMTPDAPSPANEAELDPTAASVAPKAEWRRT